MGKKDTQIEWFIRQVAEGTSGLDAREICEMSAQLGVHLGAERYFCAVVRLTESASADDGACAPMRLYRACQQARKQCALEQYCYIGDRFYTVMIIAESGGNRGLLVDKLCQSISKYAAGRIQIGVGRSYEDLGKLSYSWVEAYEALNYPEASGPVCYIDDIYVSRRSITTYKHNREKRQIVELFKNGHVEQLKESVAKLVENVRAESPVRVGQPYPTSIRRTVVELLVEILHIGADAGIDVDKLLNYEDPYSRVFEMPDTPSILTWFFEIVEMLSQNILEQHSKTDNNMLALAKKKIQDHLYDPELSLSLISSELDITSTYLSAFFIREVGVGFNEYVTGLRMEKAKKLLRETSLKVTSIASQCGFRSSSYFIVVFRKQTGMSPGEYRNTKNQNE